MEEIVREVRPCEDHGFIYVDLEALVSNYQFLKGQTRDCICAAVVKANAYGLGISEVAKSLTNAGCHTFFVATPAEAKELRSVNATADIYVLDGLFPQAASFYRTHNLRPVLNSRDEIRDWGHFCRTEKTPLPAALHIDTGMNRLGLGLDEIAGDNPLDSELESIEVALIMSHLACADDVSHPFNTLQLERFERLRTVFPETPASFANSAGILLGPAYHFDLVRPGIALYGSWPLNSGERALKTVMHLYGRLVQIRTMEAGESVGYGANYTLTRQSRIATVSVGYADGYIRALGSSNQQSPTCVAIAGHLAPVIGRVSMDLIAIDTTDVPQSKLKRGQFVELIGDNISLDDVAARAGTISYEVLTRLSPRLPRVYKSSYSPS